MNLLLIVVDDLRPALGCYGDPIALTPNIDQLADRSIRFNRAYCQQAVCSPSRQSFLTGRRPDSIKVWDLKAHFRETLHDSITLPQLFKMNGYQTQSIGKIFHGSGKPSRDPPSWTHPPVYDYVRDPKLRYASLENLRGSGLKRASSESVEVPDEAYVDGLVCNTAIKTLAGYAEGRDSFFLAVGFRKPHLPFCAPQKYWELYDRSEIPDPVPASSPHQSPELAIRSWRELEGYTDIPSDGNLSNEKIRELRHGYYACVSYVDSLIGRLLKQVRQSGLLESTVICLLGDHGFHLGEQGLWTKANNYELSTRVPLLISVPGMTQQPLNSDALVELVDVYPTLSEICGLELPAGLEGLSLMPLIQQPDRVWKKAVFSQFPRAIRGHRHQENGDIMGYAIRTEFHRYVEWQEIGTGRILFRELYDHRIDPVEAFNLAGNPDQDSTILKLQSILRQGSVDSRPSP